MINDMVAITALEERSLFTFDRGAQLMLAELGDARPDVVDLAALTAAEFALAPLFTDPRPILPLGRPITVNENAAALSVVKGDCWNILKCPDPIAQISDVLAFGGDVSKLRIARVSASEAPPDIGTLAQAVRDLEDLHRTSALEQSRRLGDSGLLRLQGFLWGAKAEILRGASVTTAIDDSAGVFDVFGGLGPGVSTGTG